MSTPLPRLREARKSLVHRKIDTKKEEAEQIPTVSADYGFFGQPEDSEHMTHSPEMYVDNTGGCQPLEC